MSIMKSCSLKRFPITGFATALTLPHTFGILNAILFYPHLTIRGADEMNIKAIFEHHLGLTAGHGGCMSEETFPSR